MRFNKLEMIAQASQTSKNFDREGVLILRERQDGFFRKTEGCSLRWFRLQGNLLFYLKGPEPWYEPMAMIILGNHQVKVLPKDENEHWPFHIVWENGVTYRIAAFNESERTLWIKALELASYEKIQLLMANLKVRLNNIRPSVDIIDYRKQKGIVLDMCEVPLCELAISCDNLLCDSYGRLPSPMAVIYVRNPKSSYIKYGATEVVENSSNPCFARTVLFRGSDGLMGDTEVRILICDVREPVSETSVPMGFIALKLGTIQEAQRMRLTLHNRENKGVGFVTISGWSLEPSYVSTSPVHNNGNKTEGQQKLPCHRRSQSLPPKLGVKVNFPSYSNMFKANFVNGHQITYRFQSGLGGDIYVHEIMSEAKICYQLPIQLLDLYIQREKELMQQLLSIGDICVHWKSRQTSLVATHIALIKHYCYSKRALENVSGPYFKASTMKDDPSLEFAPVNLHLQRMWVHNDTLIKTGFHDVITVGAFTAHTHKAERAGGLIRLLQQLKDVNSPKAELSSITNKIQAEYENVMLVRRLRDEIAMDIEMIILVLQSRQVNDLAAIIQAVITKVMKIVTMWDPVVVEETLSRIGWQKNYRGDLDNDASTSSTMQLTEQSIATDTAYSLDCTSSYSSSKELTPSTDQSAQSSSESNVCGSVGSTSADNPTELEFHKDHFDSENVDNGSGNLNLSFRSLKAPRSTDHIVSFRRGASLRHEGHCSTVLGQISYRSLMEIFNKDDKKKLDEIQNDPAAFDPCTIDQNTRQSNMAYFQSFQRGIEFVLAVVVETVLIARDRHLRGLLTVLEVTTIKELFDVLRESISEVVCWLRLSHAAMRLRCESPSWMREYASMQTRRDMCFSQALTALTAGLTSWLSSAPSDIIVKILTSGLGPLCGFEGLLSLHTAEKAMWGDMVVAIEDLHTVVFTLTNVGHNNNAYVPKVSGSRNALIVYLPVSDNLYKQITAKEHLSFTITAVFFNIGINDKATVAEALGDTKPQYQSNCDNLDRMDKYYQKYNKIFPYDHTSATRASSRTKPLEEVMENLKIAVHKKTEKNVEVIQLASLATRIMNGVSFTSCKSAKDRTGMSVTLAQCAILSSEYHLAENELPKALDVMRSEGCRRENTLKNIGMKKYAFNKKQLSSLPEQYRPPPGTYGSTRT